jgi:hypothetical protein
MSELLLEVLKDFANWAGNGVESGTTLVAALIVYVFRERILGPHLS